MAISLQCPECDAKLKLSNDALAGKKIKCPKCAASIVVPKPKAPPPDEDDELEEEEAPRRPTKKAPPPDDDEDDLDEEEAPPVKKKGVVPPPRKKKRVEEDEDEEEREEEDSEDEERPAKKKKKKPAPSFLKAYGLYLGAGAAVILIGAAAAIFLLGGGGGKKGNEVAQQTGDKKDAGDQKGGSAGNTEPEKRGPKVSPRKRPGKDSFAGMLQELSELIGDVVDVLGTVKDKHSAQAAAPRLRDSFDYLRDAASRAEKLGSPTPEERKQLEATQAKFMSQMKTFAAKMAEETTRIMALDGGPEVLLELEDVFGGPPSMHKPPGGRIILRKADKVATTDPTYRGRPQAYCKIEEITMDPGWVYSIDLLPKTKSNVWLLLLENATDLVGSAGAHGGPMRIVFEPRQQEKCKIIVTGDGKGFTGDYLLFVRQAAAEKKTPAQKEALARYETVQDLRQITMALLADENAMGRFAPADGSEAKQGGPSLVGVSWRVYALPYLETGDLFVKIRDNNYAPPRSGGQPWDRPELAKMRFPPHGQRTREKNKEPWLTNYRVFTGKGTALETGSNDFPDGRENTILVVEAAEAVPWPKPEELEYSPTKPLPKLGGRFADGFYASFADGTLRFIPKNTDEKTIRAMITRNGGEKVTLPPPVDMKALGTAAGVAGPD